MLSGLIWFPTVCKDYRQMLEVEKELCPQSGLKQMASQDTFLYLQEKYDLTFNVSPG